jgi:UDP-N-acetylmuramate dehydrogenase
MSSSTTATNIAAYTTFGVQASADAIVEISELSELQDGIRSCSSQQIPYLILGSGSNMLFAEDFPGTILLTN